jgi:glycosyltransferase involved in cell wall biosynthesis
VTFTGFLDPYREYPGLLRAADAIMVLTTRDYTLQLGGCEAVAAGKPLITSDWPYLREVFGNGTVYVSASAESIRDGVVSVQQRYDTLAQEIVALREKSREEWDVRLRQLSERVAHT